MSVVWVFKPIGWTPKDCILEYQKLVKKKMAFAGRLDPMACGLLPLIIHETEDIKQVQEVKESLQGSYKTYQFNLILGFETDTYDILGLPKKREGKYDLSEGLERVKQLKVQEYPPYSSQKVFSPHYQKKMPLWKLAKEGKLPDDLPKRDIDIESIRITGIEIISNHELLEIIKDRFNSLNNKDDYRSHEILSEWEKLLKDNNREYIIHHLEARVSTGTYIRTLCHELGGIAYDICRINMHDKSLEDTSKYDKFKCAYGI